MGTSDNSLSHLPSSHDGGSGAENYKTCIYLTITSGESLQILICALENNMIDDGSPTYDKGTWHERGASIERGRSPSRCRRETNCQPVNMDADEAAIELACTLECVGRSARAASQPTNNNAAKD